MDKESRPETAEDKSSHPEDAEADSKDSAPTSSPVKPDAGDRPPNGILRGYTQTYLVWKDKNNGASSGGGSAEDEGKDADDQTEHEVLFRCGNWCYTGHVVLSQSIALSDMPTVIPILQRQQSRLHYYCNADSIPAQSSFSKPMKMVYDATDYATSALGSDAVTEELGSEAATNAWMEDSANTFFEMGLLHEEMPGSLEDVQLVCSKTYARGLIFLTIFFEGNFYFTVADGEGDQPLLDVKFPDVSHHGQGILIKSAATGALDESRGKACPPPRWFGSLTLWHALPSEVKIAPPPTRNLSTGHYMQMYFIMRPRAENGGFAVTSAYREVLFRFGSWCYGGSVQLTPTITLADIPHVIPALRMQQSRLEYVYSAEQVPATSPYSKPMAYMMKHAPLMEREIESAESVLSKLVDRLTSMGLGDSISSWLEGDANQSFFEFSIAASDAEFKVLGPVELCASKAYYASGVVLVVIYFAGVFYVTLSDGGSEQPLLDSKFPDVSTKGRGYQVNAYGEGAPGWPGLRKVSIWQSSGAMEAEMEARVGKDAAAQAAQDAAHNPVLATSAAVEALEQSKAEAPADAKAAEPNAGQAKDGSGPAPNPRVADAKGGNSGGLGGSGGGLGGSPDVAEAKDSGGGHGAGLGDEARMKRQSLGAFHRLAPISGIQGSLSKIRNTMEAGGGLGAAPWDAGGRPLSMGKAGGSPFGKAPLDFKKGPSSP